MILFSGAVFVIMAGTIRAVLILTVRSLTLSLPKLKSVPYTDQHFQQSGVEGAVTGSEWACRETFVAILAVNIPVLKPLIVFVTTFLDDLLSSQRSKRQGNSKATPYNLNGSGVSGLPLGPIDRKSHMLRSLNGGGGWTTVGGGGSEERIVDDEEDDRRRMPALVPHETHDKETSINSTEQERKVSDDGQIWVVNT